MAPASTKKDQGVFLRNPPFEEVNIAGSQVVENDATLSLRGHLPSLRVPDITVGRACPLRCPGIHHEHAAEQFPRGLRGEVGGLDTTARPAIGRNGRKRHRERIRRGLVRPVLPSRLPQVHPLSLGTGQFGKRTVRIGHGHCIVGVAGTPVAPSANGNWNFLSARSQ